jgi:hypothetical protein
VQEGFDVAIGEIGQRAHVWLTSVSAAIRANLRVKLGVSPRKRRQDPDAPGLPKKNAVFPALAAPREHW